MRLINVAVFLTVCVKLIFADNNDCVYEVRCRFNDPRMRFCVPRYFFPAPISPSCTKNFTPPATPKGTCDRSECEKFCDDFWPWDDPPTCSPNDEPSKMVDWKRRGRKPYVSPLNKKAFKHCPRVKQVQCDDPRLQSSTSATEDGSTTEDASHSSTSVESTSTDQSTFGSETSSVDTSSSTWTTTAVSSSTLASDITSEASTSTGIAPNIEGGQPDKSESEGGLNGLVIALIVIIVLIVIMVVVAFVAWMCERKKKSKRAKSEGLPKVVSIKKQSTTPKKSTSMASPKPKSSRKAPTETSTVTKPKETPATPQKSRKKAPKKAVKEMGPKKEALSLAEPKTGPPSTPPPVMEPPKKPAEAPESITADASQSSGFAIDYEMKRSRDGTKAKL